jgi:taurine dioxygenase
VLGATPLDAPFGVRVDGLDATLDAVDRERLRSWFDEHHLLIFRGTEIPVEIQLAVCQSIGPVADPPNWVSNVEKGGYHPEWKLLFHSDFIFTPDPFDGIALYADRLAPGAAPTLFVDAVRACAELPSSLRSRLEGRQLVHMADITDDFREDVRLREADVGGPDSSRRSYPRTTRPALWPHPRTGEPILCATEQQASHFIGMSDDESEELLAEVFGHLYGGAYTHVHHWQPADLVVWDNLSVQHGRPEAPRPIARSLRRVTIHDRSFAALRSAILSDDWA